MTDLGLTSWGFVVIGIFAPTNFRKTWLIDVEQTPNNSRDNGSGMRVSPVEVYGETLLSADRGLERMQLHWCHYPPIRCQSYCQLLL